MTEGKILNRVVRATTLGWVYEVVVLIEELQFFHNKPYLTRRIDEIKDKNGVEDSDEPSLLEPE